MQGKIEIIDNLTLNGSNSALARPFIKHANQNIAKINELIYQYWGTDDRKEQLETLYQINDLRKKLEDEHPQDVYLPAFIEQIEDKLFKVCQIEFKKFNISMHEQSLAKKHPTNPIPSETPINPFADMLANLSPDAGRNMLSVLSGDKFYPSTLEKLYQNSNRENNQIIRNYECNSLGGVNCKNYILTSRNTLNPSQFVLRNDNRLGGARELDTYIRNSPLADIVTPIEAVRSLTLDGKTTTLLITSLCPGGTPEAHSKRCKNDQEILDGALDIFSQMGTILTRINNENILFPDAKNSNWLLDSQGKVVLADTKALLFSDNGFHDLNVTYEKNKWILGSEPYPITSVKYSPPEIHNQRFDVDKMHGFILGQNLYQYLTQCTADELCHKIRIGYSPIKFIPKTADSLNFNLPIFQTPTGQRLKALIEQMIVDDPSQRMGAEAATNEIKRIKILSINQEILTRLEMNFAPNDTRMSAYISEKSASMENATLEELLYLEQRLKDIEKQPKLVEHISTNQTILDGIQTQSSAQDSQMVKFIKEERMHIESTTPDELPRLIPKLEKIEKQNKKVYQFIDAVKQEISQARLKTGAEQKLNSITAALYKIPVEQRSEMMGASPQLKEIADFQQAVGTRRTILGRFSPTSTVSENIFNRYKAKYDEIITSEEPKSDKNTDLTPKR